MPKPLGIEQRLQDDYYPDPATGELVRRKHKWRYMPPLEGSLAEAVAGIKDVAVLEKLLVKSDFNIDRTAGGKKVNYVLLNTGECLDVAIYKAPVKMKSSGPNLLRYCVLASGTSFEGQVILAAAMGFRAKENKQIQVWKEGQGFWHDLGNVLRVATKDDTQLQKILVDVAADKQGGAAKRKHAEDDDETHLQSLASMARVAPPSSKKRGARKSTSVSKAVLSPPRPSNNTSLLDDIAAGSSEEDDDTSFRSFPGASENMDQDLMERFKSQTRSPFHVMQPATTSPRGLKVDLKQTYKDWKLSRTTVVFKDEDGETLRRVGLSGITDVNRLLIYAAAAFRTNTKNGAVLEMNVHGAVDLTLVDGDEDDFKALMQAVLDDAHWKTEGGRGRVDQSATCRVEVSLLQA
jgi:hypothetical protein